VSDQADELSRQVAVLEAQQRLLRNQIEVGRLQRELRRQRSPWVQYHGNTVLLVVLIALALIFEFTVLALVPAHH
jgi:hypothetical protein